MYIEPQQYKRLKCGHTFDYSPDRDRKLPVFEEREEADRGIIDGVERMQRSVQVYL